MPTTLDLDEDVLEAVMELADLQGKSAGEVVSELVRKALTPEPPLNGMRNGILLLKGRGQGRLVTSAFVKKLEEELWQASPAG